MFKNFNKIEKIVVNTGLGKLRQQPQFEEKILPEIIREMSLITGQKPAVCQSKKSIAGFKVRSGETVGLKVTLRGQRMNDFLKRLINVVLPRVKDFRGLDLKSIDSAGNLTIGIEEQFVFPEIEIDTSKVNFGLEISIVPQIKKDIQAIDLYRQIGLPLKKV